MKKTRNYIIIALAALVVLGGLLAVLLYTEPETPPEEDPTSSTAGPAQMLVNRDITEVKDIVFYNAEFDNTFTMVPVKYSETSEAVDTFIIQGWEDEDLNRAALLNLAKYFYNNTVTKEIGQVKNLSEYGLSGKGQYNATVHYNDGSKQEIVVGNNAGESYGRYCLVDGTVYIATFSGYVQNSALGFVNTKLYADIETPTIVDDQGNEMAGYDTLEDMTLSGTQYPDPIHVIFDPVGIVTNLIDQPILSGMSVNRSDAITNQLKTCTAKGTKAVNATAEEKTENGFDDPVAAVDFTINGVRHTITLGKKDGSMYTAMVDDNDNIYLLAADSVNTWAEADLFSLRDSFVTLINIKEVARLTITDAKGTDVYNATRIKNEDRSTETTTIYDLQVEKDGKEISYDNAYQPYYQKLLSVAVLNEGCPEPTGKPILTIDYEMFEDDTEWKVAYYKDPTSDRRYVVTLNGSPTGVVRSSTIDELLELKPLLAENGNLKGE